VNKAEMELHVWKLSAFATHLLSKSSQSSTFCAIGREVIFLVKEQPERQTEQQLPPSFKTQNLQFFTSK
jgi:hypothetical protein